MHGGERYRVPTNIVPPEGAYRAGLGRRARSHTLSERGMTLQDPELHDIDSQPAFAPADKMRQSLHSTLPQRLRGQLLPYKNTQTKLRRRQPVTLAISQSVAQNARGL